jgi:arsenite methyltransferase
MAGSGDRWARWLLDVRHGGDEAFRTRMLESLYLWRDEILDKAPRSSPATRCWTWALAIGLVAFGALYRLGPSGHVILSDASQDLLDHCREAAAEEGLLDRCSFVGVPGLVSLGMDTYPA